MGKPSSKNNEKIAARIMRASEIASYQHALIYAETGQGKTRLSATAPNVLLIDVNDKGTSSTKRDTNPKVFHVEFWSELAEDLYWYLQSGDHNFDTYAIDGLTSARTLCLNFVLGDEASRDAARDPNMPTRQIHGKVGQLMRTMITNYRNLPMNGVFTAQTRVLGGGDEEDDDEGPRKIAPDLPASVANHIEQAVDTIGYLTKRSVVVKKKGGTKKRVVRTRLITGLTDKYVTKDRDRIYGEYIDSPNLTEMFKIANQEE
jgi:hypothetical protein